VTNATRCSDTAAIFFVAATFVLGSFKIGLTPAMAAGDQYGCRGDQACVKIAVETQCDKPCQIACKEYRFDQEMCYKTWGPKLLFEREQQKKGIK
jgi:hypothetical protein